MDRFELFKLYKDLLSKYGAIPKKEEDYIELVLALINIYQQKH